MNDIETRRIEPQYVPPTAEDWEVVLAAMEGLRNLIATYGAVRVQIWVRNLAALRGEDIERPSHLCLADGAALRNRICVQCGRDNS